MNLYTVAVISDNELTRNIIISYLPEGFELTEGIQTDLLITDPVTDIDLEHLSQPIIITYKHSDYYKMFNIWNKRSKNYLHTNHISIPFYREDLISRIIQLGFTIL